jgi:putative aminopeptidase FrvX
MDIRAKFLELTSKTYPIGKEKEVYKLLPDNFIKDPFDNLYWIIGKSDTLFCAHLDTYSVGDRVDVVHVFDGNIVKTNGKSILGADDKAGVAIMLYMIEKQIPGFYLFTVGEEKGCQGSAKLSQKLQTKMDDKYKNIKKIIAFDRSGYNSIITHQMEQRSCSDAFANALIAEFGKFGLKFTIDIGGYYCDSAEFADLIPECTNISVGYFDQHSNAERQDLAFLEAIAETCCKINWTSLPVKRDPKKVEYIDSYYFSRKKMTVEGEDETEFDDYDFHPFAVEENKEIEVFYFEDQRYNFISDISYLNGEIVDINLSQKRVNRELEAITKYMEENQISYEYANWDGLILTVEHDNHETKISRNDLLKYIPILDIEFIKKETKSVK